MRETKCWGEGQTMMTTERDGGDATTTTAVGPCHWWGGNWDRDNDRNRTNAPRMVGPCCLHFAWKGFLFSFSFFY